MFTNDDSYLQQYAKKTGFQAVKFLPVIHNTKSLTLILSSTFLSSITTVILNSSFKK